MCHTHTFQGRATDPDRRRARRAGRGDEGAVPPGAVCPDVGHGPFARGRLQLHRRRRHGPVQTPSFRISVCAAHTLNATGPSRVTLSLRQEQLRAGCGSRQEKKGPEMRPTSSSQARASTRACCAGAPTSAPSPPPPTPVASASVAGCAALCCASDGCRAYSLNAPWSLGSARPAQTFFCASVCAARTLNAVDQSRVTLSLRQEITFKSSQPL